MNWSGLVLIALLYMVLATAGCVSDTEIPAPVPAAGTPQDMRPHVSIGVDADFLPFTARDNGGNFSGFDIDAARWVAEREGFDVEFVAVPWDTAVSALDSGSIDLIWSGMTITEERRARVNFSVPYYTVNKSVAARAGSGVTMQDFYDGRLRVGVQAGASEADWVLKNLVQNGRMPASNLSRYPDITALTDGLENGTIDVSIIQSPSQKRAIAGRPLGLLGTIPSEDRYAVAVRKSDPELQATVDKGLLALMKDPYWKELLQTYDLES
ncbi:MAG TPA: ABC transporter substrate-binding protein [Methanoregula sp.]|nr:ABC transporter substrate-binding protein [Methanoregula sp.]